MKIIICILIFPTTLFSQIQEINTSHPDSLFYVANNFAKAGELKQCRKICYAVIEEHPDYTDFFILAARTLGWENNFDSAKNVIEPVHIAEPHNKQIILLLADIEIWQMQFENALAFIDTGLVYNPKDIDLLKKREEILNKIASNKLTNPISFGTIYPDSNAVGIAYFFEFFRKPYIARRHIISAQYTKITDFAPLSFRLNIGDNTLNGEKIFEKPSYQLEIDAYPKLDNKSYLYLNYGVGKGSFFPSHRVGAEYFRGLISGFESSAGIRYMYWDNSILFLTGSISKYIDSYWLSFRPYFSIKNNIFSDAYIFETRKYYGIYNSYIFGSVIFGDSPDQPLTLAQEFGNFKSIKFITGIQHRVSKFQFNASFGAQRDEYLLNKYRIRTEYILGINYVF